MARPFLRLDDYVTKSESVIFNTIQYLCLHRQGYKSNRCVSFYDPNQRDDRDDRAPCFGRHVKPLVPAAFGVVGTYSSFKEGDVGQAAGRKNNYRIFITT
jgi:hypothetical protein